MYFTAKYVWPYKEFDSGFFSLMRTIQNTYLQYKRQDINI